MKDQRRQSLEGGGRGVGKSTHNYKAHVRERGENRPASGTGAICMVTRDVSQVSIPNTVHSSERSRGNDPLFIGQRSGKCLSGTFRVCRLKPTTPWRSSHCHIQGEG